MIKHGKLQILKFLLQNLRHFALVFVYYRRTKLWYIGSRRPRGSSILKIYNLNRSDLFVYQYKINS